MNVPSARLSRTKLITGIFICGCSLLGVGFGLEMGRQDLGWYTSEKGAFFKQVAEVKGAVEPVVQDASTFESGDQKIERQIEQKIEEKPEQRRDETLIVDPKQKANRYAEIDPGARAGANNETVKAVDTIVDGEVEEALPNKASPSQVAASDVDNLDNEEELYRELEVFTSVLAIVQRDYVQKVSGKKLVEGAIKGMLTALDPHSGYLDAEFFQDLQSQTKGEFGGLGVEITVRDGSLVVVAPMEGSPAERAGLRSGDQIVKIGAESTKQFSIIDAVKRLRGPRGSEVQLSVVRQGVAEPLELMIVRDNITLKSVRSRYLGDGFGYIRVNQFAEKTSEDLKNALKSFRDQSDGQQIKGLVLDLRNNPGGLLSQAVAVGDLFLDEGIIVYTDGRVEGQRQKFYAHPRGTEPKYPMIVMVNGGSASASEIVAGSLKESGRALVLGSQTFGKGSVQTITPLENGGAVTLTTALYYTRSGRSLQALGVAPDIAIDAAGQFIKAEGNSKAGVKNGSSTAADGASSEAKDEKSVDSQPSGAQSSSHEEKDLQPELGEANQEELIREGDLPGAIKNPDLTHEESKVQGVEGRRLGAPNHDDTKKMPLLNEKARTIESSINYEKDDISAILTRDPQLDKAYSILRSFGEFD